MPWQFQLSVTPVLLASFEDLSQKVSQQVRLAILSVASHISCARLCSLHVPLQVQTKEGGEFDEAPYKAAWEAAGGDCGKVASTLNLMETPKDCDGHALD